MIEIVNKNKIKIFKKVIKEDGLNSLQVLSDFDKTLTIGKSNRSSSLISILRDKNILDSDYSKKAKKLFEIYHAFENDTSFSLSFRRKKMEEWWMRHFKLLVKYDLKKGDIYRAVDIKKPQLRRGVKSLLKILNNYNIPLLIMSAGGLGIESIRYFLEKEKLIKNNIYIVANDFIWDSRDNAVDVKRPIIHSLNKNEAILSQYNFFDHIKKKKNVVLLGDSLGDADMVQGFRHKNVIKIAFLNSNQDKINDFRKKFDIIVKEDSASFILNLFRELIELN